MSVTVPSGTRRSQEVEMKSVVGFEISQVCGKGVKGAGWRNVSHVRCVRRASSWNESKE